MNKYKLTKKTKNKKNEITLILNKYDVFLLGTYFLFACICKMT